MLDISLFDEAKTITQVYALAQKLKAEGHDVSEVNGLATIKKKQLVSKSSLDNALEKIVPKSSSTNKSNVSQFAINVKNINSGVIRIKADGTIEL